LLTAFGSTLASLFMSALVVASTAIRIRDSQLIFSATAKAGTDAGQQLLTQTKFRYCFFFASCNH
jgi:hypothetical protein